MQKEKSRDEVREFVRRVAEHQGWKIVDDGEFLDDLVDGLTTNFNRHGYFLCPCRDGAGERKKDRDIICPCRYAAEDIAEYGHCYCGLFLSEQFKASGRAPEQLPERRPEEYYMQ